MSLFKSKLKIFTRRSFVDRMSIVFLMTIVSSCTQELSQNHSQNHSQVTTKISQHQQNLLLLQDKLIPYNSNTVVQTIDRNSKIKIVSKIQRSVANTTEITIANSEKSEPESEVKEKKQTSNSGSVSTDTYIDNKVINKPTPLECCSSSYWIEFGLGVHFDSYNQKYDTLSDIKFSQIGSKHTFYKTGFNIYNSLDLNLIYSKSSGVIKNGSSIQVESEQYDHQNMTALLNYHVLPSSPFAERRYELVFGFNNESLPFVVPTDINTITTYQLEKINALLGINYYIKKHQRLEIYSGLSMTYPLSYSLSNSNQYTEKNSYNLGLNIGAKHLLSSSGMYLNSNLESHFASQEFTYNSNTNNYSGKQQYLFINFNLGIGYEF